MGLLPNKVDFKEMPFYEKTHDGLPQAMSTI